MEQIFVSAIQSYEEYFNKYYTQYRKFILAITRRYVQNQDFYKCEITNPKHKHEYMIKLEIIQNLKVIAKQIKKGKKDEKTGVYIIKYPWQIQKIKIGWSDNIHHRFKAYNTTFCGEQKLIFHLQILDKDAEENIFSLAQSIGMIRNKNYEVFDYQTDEQIAQLITQISNIYGQIQN